MAFSKDESKTYGKLDPSKVAAGTAEADSTDWTEGKSVAELLAEGEGALSGDTEAEKRHPADFVLWKASKAGEPADASIALIYAITVVMTPSSP